MEGVAHDPEAKICSCFLLKLRELEADPVVGVCKRNIRGLMKHTQPGHFTGWSQLFFSPHYTTMSLFLFGKVGSFWLNMC